MNARPTKQRILDEIRRCAVANGDRPLGIDRFEQETGIAVRDWAGRYWARWGDAVSEAGFEPNGMQDRKHDDELLCQHLAVMTQELGHFPTSRELRMRRLTDPEFPNDKVFSNRIGNRAQQISATMQFAESRNEFAGAYAICRSLIQASMPVNDPVDEADGSGGHDGYVYLLRAGKTYKIGRQTPSSDANANSPFSCRRGPKGFTSSARRSHRHRTLLAPTIRRPATQR